MHERSLVQALIEQVLEEGRVRGLGRIHEIQFQIGEFSGVEPMLVESAFAEMASEHWDYEIRLMVEVVPLTATCQTCGEAFHIEGFRFLCPRCGGGNVQVTAGEEMRLASVRAERQTAYLDCDGLGWKDSVQSEKCKVRSAK